MFHKRIGLTMSPVQFHFSFLGDQSAFKEKLIIMSFAVNKDPFIKSPYINAPCCCGNLLFPTHYPVTAL